MIAIAGLAPYLYMLVVMLVIVVLLFFTPMLMDKLPWTKSYSSDKKVLTALPVLMVVIITAIVSVWKLQGWSQDYLIRSGHAQIGDKYSEFLLDEYPDLGVAYQRVIADRYSVDRHILKLTTSQSSLRNHHYFISKVKGRWIMILDQLRNLQGSIETKSVSPRYPSDVARQLALEVNETYVRIQRSKQLIGEMMVQHANNSTEYLVRSELSSPHYAISKRNYDRIIDYFLDEHNGLIDPLNDITQIIRSSNQTMGELQNKLSQQGNHRRKVAYRVLSNWGDTKKYAHKRLFKVLYALETEYVLKEMGLHTSHPAMQRLSRSIPDRLQRYSEDVRRRWEGNKQNSNPQIVLSLH